MCFVHPLREAKEPDPRVRLLREAARWLPPLVFRYTLLDGRQERPLVVTSQDRSGADIDPVILAGDERE